MFIKRDMTRVRVLKQYLSRVVVFVQLNLEGELLHILI